MTRPLSDHSNNAVHPAFRPPKQHFCDHFITHEELGSDDPWAGTYCKRAHGHDGPHSALYADEREGRYRVYPPPASEGAASKETHEPR